MDSPLLFPVKLVGTTIRVLDETALPFEEIYLDVETFEQALWVLESMKTRSLGQVLLFFYACQLFGDINSVEAIVAAFGARRPTFDFPLLGQMLTQQAARGVSVPDSVSAFVTGFDQGRRARAKVLAQKLPDPAHILTLCNVNGELIYLAQELSAAGKEFHFFVCETRPYLQGTRLTLWELAKNDIACTLLCDAQAAALMREGKVTCVVTGADRAAKEGGVINKIGTYALARLADTFGIPFYPLTQYPRDIDIDSIVIEERDSQETFMFLHGDYLFDAVYPAFDVTPAQFVTEPMVLPVFEPRARLKSS